MDLITLVSGTVAKTRIPFTFDDVGYFRSNPRVIKFDSVYKKLLENVVNVLQGIAQSFEAKLPITSQVELTTTLDFWSNMMLGRSGDAHSHLME